MRLECVSYGLIQPGTCVKTSETNIHNFIFTIIKEARTQVFSCEICKTFKNTFSLQNTSGGCFWR